MYAGQLGLVYQAVARFFCFIGNYAYATKSYARQVHFCSFTIVKSFGVCYNL